MPVFGRIFKGAKRLPEHSFEVAILLISAAQGQTWESLEIGAAQSSVLSSDLRSHISKQSAG
jgi:hypothetical protein